MGHSAAVFVGPVVASYCGRDAVFHTVAVLSAIWAVSLFLLALYAPATVRPGSMAAMIAILTKERLACQTTR